MNFFSNYLSPVLLALLLALGAFLGTQAKNLYQKYITTEIKQSVCRTVVRFVEQVYVDLHGPEKLKQAMARAAAILKEYGIEISDTELVAMIEAAVNEFNNAFKKDTLIGKHEKAEASSNPENDDLVYRVPDGSVDLRNFAL